VNRRDVLGGVVGAGTATVCGCLSPRGDDGDGTERAEPLDPAIGGAPMFQYDTRNSGVADESGGTAGDERFEIEVADPIRSSPAVVDGVVYFGGGRWVYAVDAADGEQLWAAETSGAVRSSPAVVDGTVYVGNTERSVFRPRCRQRNRTVALRGERSDRCLGRRLGRNGLRRQSGDRRARVRCRHGRRNRTVVV